MPLKFGLLDTKDDEEFKGFNSAFSGQIVVSAFLTIGASTLYQTVYTVTTGKTLFISTLVFGGQGAETALQLGLGDVTIFGVMTPASNAVIINLKTPITFTSGQVVQAKQGTSDSGSRTFSFVGWEE